MNRYVARCLALFVLAAGAARGADFQVAVTGGKEDQTNVVISAPLPRDAGAQPGPAVVTTSDGKTLAAQVTGPHLLAPEGTAAELVFVLPELKAGQTLTFGAKFGGGTGNPAFAWKQNADGLEQLTFNGRPVLEYFHRPFDAQAAKDTIQNPTIKPFHHLYDPAGKVLLTNGVHGTLFPHHRGIFFGFNKITFDGKSADTWHGKPPGAHQSHEKVLASEAGPVLGRHRVAIDWHGADGSVFAREERELTAFNVPGGTLVGFESVLRAESAKVKLDGDPQHAGFQFRANNEVAVQSQQKKPQTYFLRPDGKGDVGETRNWDAKNKGPVNLPWDAMSFVVGGKRYTVVYLDRPGNPKEARFSERDYGRFGSYFEYELTKDRPLRLSYRLWAQEGEMTMGQCDALDRAFADPPRATVSVR